MSATMELLKRHVSIPTPVGTRLSDPSTGPLSEQRATERVALQTVPRGPHNDYPCPSWRDRLGRPRCGQGISYPTMEGGKVCLWDPWLHSSLMCAGILKDIWSSDGLVTFQDSWDHWVIFRACPSAFGLQPLGVKSAGEFGIEKTDRTWKHWSWFPWWHAEYLLVLKNPTTWIIKLL